MFNKSNEFREYSSVYIEEFLGGWLIQGKHLHSGDLKALLKNDINDLSSFSIGNSVWLYDAASAGREVAGRPYIRGEEVIGLSLP